ncbi:MAG: hypothetical protein ABJC33_01400 [Betaproteobacteria bacterium]
MHEIYMLAVLSRGSRSPAAAQTRDERIREEQAFYDLHGRNRSAKSGFWRFAPAPLVLAASAAVISVMGLTQLLLH